MYSTRTGLILGFHGCDKSLIDDLLKGNITLENSTNKHDWLGHGIYFWDNSPSRALEFATFLKHNPSRSKKPIENPAVIGTIINLGYCLDLLDYKNLSLVKEGYTLLSASYRSLGKDIPANQPVGGNKDLLLRELDCAVIETVHQFRKQTKMRSFDSIRGVFWEGDPLYENAGFREKDHIQICIRNPNCIKGYFLPVELNSKYPSV